MRDKFFIMYLKKLL